MKKIIKQLEKSRDLLQDKFDSMDEKFWNRSDKWQESDKGQEWDEEVLVEKAKEKELGAV